MKTTHNYFLILLAVIWSMPVQAYNSDFFKVIRAGDAVKAERMIVAGVDVNDQDYKGMTALMRAASFGHVDVVKLLIRKKATINIRDLKGNSVLKHAAWSDKVEIIDLLIKNGAVLEEKNDLGTTPIWSAIITARLKMVERLLKHGANPNVPNQYGMSAIRFAKSRDEWALVELLELANAEEF